MSDGPRRLAAPGPPPPPPPPPPRMLLVHPIREVVRFLPALIALFVAGYGHRRRRLAVRRRRGADRPRHPALPDHQLPDQPGPGRAAARPAQPARGVHPARPGPHRRPDLAADPPAARPDHPADRHGHRRRRRPRPRRPAGGGGPTAARRAAARDVVRRGQRAVGRLARHPPVRPSLGALRPAHQHRRGHRRRRPRGRRPGRGTSSAAPWSSASTTSRDGAARTTVWVAALAPGARCPGDDVGARGRRLPGDLLGPQPAPRRTVLGTSRAAWSPRGRRPSTTAGSPA